MNAPLITGGESFDSPRSVSDADMADVKLLLDRGFGRNELPDNAGLILDSLKRRRCKTPAQAYKEWALNARDFMASLNPAVQREWKRANDAFLRTVHNSSPSVSSVHTNAVMQDLSLQYRNEDYIGETLCPAVLVKDKGGVYYTYGKADRLTPSATDVVSELGEAQEVVESRSSTSYSCQDRANKNGIAANTVAAADSPLNELFDLTESLAEHRALAREIRISTLLTTNTNYASTNRTTLSGANQWDAAGGGDPIGDIQTGMAALWRGRAPARTVAFSDLLNYHALSKHEDILGLFQYAGQPIGLATPALIAGFFGMDDYVVGKGWYNTAAEGATASYSRIWGDYFGILRVPQRATLRSACFAVNFRWLMAGVPGANQGILSQQWFDATKGLGGSYWAKVGESEVAAVIANDTGYLISDCLV